MHQGTSESTLRTKEDLISINFGSTRTTHSSRRSKDKKEFDATVKSPENCFQMCTEVLRLFKEIDDKSKKPKNNSQLLNKTKTISLGSRPPTGQTDSELMRSSLE